MKPIADTGLMRRRSGAGVLVLGAAYLVLGCGMGSSDGGDTTDGGVGNQDGNANIECEFGLVLPLSATINQEIEVGVEVFPASSEGARDFQWIIDRAGVEEGLTQLSNSGDRVSFTPTTAGPFDVVVTGTAGPLVCKPAVGVINVTALGAIYKDYRMRVVPLGDVPVQDFSVRVAGGADTSLPPAQLEAGQTVSATLEDADGTGVPAYLRVRKQGTLVPTDYEGFSDANGAFSFRLPPGETYDLLAVPSGGTLPSLLLENLSLADLNTTITMPTPETLSGHLFDLGNSPVQGALVSLVIDGVATTADLTGADGSFSVLGATGQLSGLRVAPLPGSGMPALRAEGLSGQAVAGGTDVVIQYANSVVTAEVDLTLASGAAAAGALVEWRAKNSQAARVNAGTGDENVAGDLRVLATADGSGHAQVNLAAMVTDLSIQSADATEGLVQTSLDWNASPTTSAALAELVPVSIGVTFANAAAEGAQILAMPVDSLAPQGAATGGVVSASGTASLSLVKGANYQLVAFAADKGSRVVDLVDIAPAMVVSDVELPKTLRAIGSVSVAGNAATGARVSIYCSACSGSEATRVLAQAVVNSTGKFELRIEDPGVEAP